VTRLGYNAVVLTLTDDRAHLAISHVTFEPAVVRAAEKLVGVSMQDFRLPLVPGGFLQRIIVEGETAFRSTGEIMAEALPGPLHPLAGQLATLLGLRQSIVARLTVGDEAHGLLVVSGTGLTEADVPAVTAFANQAAIAIENARLFEQVRAAREQLRDLASYLQAAREEERAEIAREIHDEFGQALSALNMDLFWLSKRLPADQPHLAEKASAMSDLIDSTIQTVRHVATELRPGLLDDLGLAAAMEWQAEEFAERTGIDCELYLSNAEIVLDRDLATVIFRIFQETLTNVVRHSEATEVRVELKDRPDELVLIVRDNGRGITESQVSHPRSLGLMGMRERAYSWGGEVAFQGVPGQGTTVTVRIPNSEFEGGYDQSACCR
jgi:signal transduction histidine kinase